jgi:hypothetical protein
MPSVAEQVRRVDHPEIAAERPQPPRDLVAEKLRGFPAARLNRRIATHRYEVELDRLLATIAR